MKKTAENAQDKKNLMLANIVRTTDAAVIGLTMEGEIQFWNNAAKSIFGYSQNEIIGQSVVKLVDENEWHILKDILDIIISGRKYHRVELTGINKNGKKIHISVTISKFADEKSQFEGISVIARDISDRILAEKELKESKDKLREYARYIQTVRENERKKLALEVHDKIGHALTAITLDLSYLLKKVPPENIEAHDKINKMFDLIDDTADTVSNITSELRPTVLDHFGLVAAIEWQIGEFRKRSGIYYSLNVFPQNLNVDKYAAVVLFRIFQEIMTNIVRHADAEEVSIRLERKEDIITMAIKDNGKGINKSQIESPHSFGLIGIMERASTLDGTVQITGEKNKGTIVKVTIPDSDHG